MKLNSEDDIRRLDLGRPSDHVWKTVEILLSIGQGQSKAIDPIAEPIQAISDFAKACSLARADRIAGWLYSLRSHYVRINNNKSENDHWIGLDPSYRFMHSRKIIKYILGKL